MTVASRALVPLADGRRGWLSPGEARGETTARLIPVGLLVVLLSHYPGSIARRASLGQYFTGVYRSRVLARELILGIANGIDRVTGAQGGGPLPGFAVAWVTVTGGGFLAAWWLLRRHVRGRAALAGPVEMFIVAVMAATAAVRTPYDFVSYALIIATVVAAGSGRTILTAGLAAAAVATRESGLLAVAIIMASCAVPPTPAGGARPLHRRQVWQSMGKTAARHRPLWAAAAAALTTYLVLKIVFRSGGALILFQPIEWRDNLTARSAWALALAAVLVATGRWATGPAGAALRTRRRVLWLLALPYLAVVARGGIWAEAPRLVMPLVLGETLLAVGAAPQPQRLPKPPTARRGVVSAALAAHTHDMDPRNRSLAYGGRNGMAARALEAGDT